MSLVIHHGRLFAVVGQPRCWEGTWFVPACGEIEAPAANSSHPLADHAAISFPWEGDFELEDTDSVWVRAALSGLFHYAPLHVGDGRNFLLDALFFAVLLDAGEGGEAYPFACTDDGLSTGLVFSRLGPNAQVQERIAAAFWGLLLAEGPEHLAGFSACGIRFEAEDFETDVEAGYAHGRFYAVDLFNGPEFDFVDEHS